MALLFLYWATPRGFRMKAEILKTRTKFRVFSFIYRQNSYI
jgi:hypothetical protein